MPCPTSHSWQGAEPGGSLCSLQIPSALLPNALVDCLLGTEAPEAKSEQGGKGGGQSWEANQPDATFSDVSADFSVPVGPARFRSR